MFESFNYFLELQEKHDEEGTKYHYTSLTYSPEYNISIQGKPFIVDVHTLSNLGLIRKTYVSEYTPFRQQSSFVRHFPFTIKLVAISV